MDVGRAAIQCDGHQPRASTEHYSRWKTLLMVYLGHQVMQKITIQGLKQLYRMCGILAFLIQGFTHLMIRLVMT